MWNLKYVIAPLAHYDFSASYVQNTTDVTNKTMYIVNKGFTLLGSDRALTRILKTGV